MTRLAFEILCGEFLISPDLALESQAIREALADRDNRRVLELLRTEF